MKQILFFAVFLISLSAWSQTRISGVLVDEKGLSVPYANVSFLNSSEGTTTTAEGKFYLKSDKNHHSVEFSFVGYKPHVLLLKKGDNLNLKVVLKEYEILIIKSFYHHYFHYYHYH